MKSKKYQNEELSFWCSQLQISPDDFFKIPYSELEEKFRNWKSTQSLEQLKNKKLEFIRNYAMKNLRPSRCRGGTTEPSQCSEICHGHIKANVSLKDVRRNQDHDLLIWADTNLQGINECQLKGILGAPAAPEVRITRVQMSVTEDGSNETKMFNIYRGENGNLQVDCPKEWDEFITNL